MSQLLPLRDIHMLTATAASPPFCLAMTGRALPYAVTVVLLVAIFVGSPNFRAVSGTHVSPFGGDVLQEWIGGHLVCHGDYARFYDVSYAQALEHDAKLVGFSWEESKYFPLVYPPCYYWLVSPLSWLPFHVAAILWATLMVLAYLAAWTLFERCISSRNNRVAWPVHWLLTLSLFFMPLIENFTTCQKGSVLLLILTGTYYFLTNGRPYFAGLLFGLMAIKPQLALPIAIAMLCKQQWRFVLGGLTTGSLLVGLCLLFGLDVCRQYVDFSRHALEYLHNSGYELTKSHAWNGFFALALGRESTFAPWCTLTAQGLTIFLVARALRGPLQANSQRFAWQFSALIVATLLLSPHLYTYDLTVLLLPLGLVAVCNWSEPGAVREVTSTQTWLALLLFCLAGFSTHVAATTSLQLSVPLLLAFLVAHKKAADIIDGPL